MICWSVHLLALLCLFIAHFKSLHQDCIVLAILNSGGSRSAPGLPNLCWGVIHGFYLYLLTFAMLYFGHLCKWYWQLQEKQWTPVPPRLKMDYPQVVLQKSCKKRQYLHEMPVPVYLWVSFKLWFFQKHLSMADKRVLCQHCECQPGKPESTRCAKCNLCKFNDLVPD